MLVKKGSPDGLGIMFLHGYGANAADLSSLAPELSWSDQENWYFPDAPLEVPIGPHSMGRAWFPIPIRELQSGVDYSSSTPPGLMKAAAHIENLLKEIPQKRIVLGGFSQGAMLATQVVLNNPSRFAGLMILSGHLVHGGIWKKLAEKSTLKTFFQSHGTGDPVLPFAGAENLHKLLTDCGWSGDLHAFRGGHEIPQGVLRDLKSYLRGLA